MTSNTAFLLDRVRAACAASESVCTRAAEILRESRALVIEIRNTQRLARASRRFWQWHPVRLAPTERVLWRQNEITCSINHDEQIGDRYMVDVLVDNRIVWSKRFKTRAAAEHEASRIRQLFVDDVEHVEHSPTWTAPRPQQRATDSHGRTGRVH